MNLCSTNEVKTLCCLVRLRYEERTYFYKFNQCSFLVIFQFLFLNVLANVFLFSVRHEHYCMRNPEGNALILVFALTNLMCLLKCECK